MSHNDVTTALSSAREYLAIAVNEGDHLDDLPADLANTYEVRQMRHREAVAFKSAEVHALIAIAEGLAPKPVQTLIKFGRGLAPVAGADQ